MNDIKYSFKDNLKQAQALRLILNDEDIDMLYGGAKGGGKTYLFCVGAFLYAHKLIKLFGLDNINLEYPLITGFLGRKRGSDFRHTTLETWKKVIHPETYRIKEQSSEIVIFDKNRRPTISYWFGGLDDQKTINKFNSAELAYIGVDQAEECEKAEISVLEASRRLTYNGIKPPYKTFYSANPAECWLKDDFVHNKRDNLLEKQYQEELLKNEDAKRKYAYYIPALPGDNGYLPTGYVQQLEKSFADNEELLQAYRDGNWDILTSSMRVIPINLIEGVRLVDKKYPFKKRIISCDTSLGGDECVIYYWENYKILDAVYCHHTDEAKIKQEITTLAYKYLHNNKRCNNVAIDTSCKTGHAVANMLQNEEYNVIWCNSAEKAKKISTCNRHFSNHRSEMWWKTRELFQEKKVSYPQDEKLRNQLTAIKFMDSYFGNGIIKLEPKNITKQNIGQSPDRADAFIYGASSFDQIDPEMTMDDYTFSVDNEEVQYQEVACM